MQVHVRTRFGCQCRRKGLSLFGDKCNQPGHAVLARKLQKPLELCCLQVDLLLRVASPVTASRPVSSAAPARTS